LPEEPASPDVRASDDDRERVVALLKEHCAAGRLTLDELPDRVACAYAATTIRELAELTHDLPGRSPRALEPAPAGTASRPWVPGILPFSETIGERRTHLMVHGTAPLGIRRAFAELRD
jgi:Domain of unknown function (DUF1707)